MPMPMWGYSTGYGWASFFWMALSMVFWLFVLLGVLGLLVWALARWLGHGPTHLAAPPPPPASALDVLRQRYAGGEIDEPTYLRMREQLAAPQLREPVGAGR